MLDTVSQSRAVLSSPQVLQIIKKKPYSQVISGIEFTYSMLSKKQQTFVLTNDRFLVLKGIQSISYARNLPQKTNLPFRQQTQMPFPKTIFPISEIETFTNEQQRLIIQFSDDKKTKWQFICPSKVCALEWRKKLEIATTAYNQFKQSKYQKYDDYVKSKQQEKDQYKNIANSRAKNILGESQVGLPIFQNSVDRNATHDNMNKDKIGQNEEKMLRKSRTEIGNQLNEGVVVKVPDNTQRQMINIGKEATNNMQQHQQKPKVQNKTQNVVVIPIVVQKVSIETEKKVPSRPMSAFFKGPQLIKVQEMFLSDDTPQAPLITKSMSNISLSGKQQIKSQIQFHRRNWTDELIVGEQQSQLMLDFKNYINRIVETLVSELYVPQESKIYPYKEYNKEKVIYDLDDVTVEIYFLNQEHIQHKHKKYREAVNQFKNLDYLVQVTQNQHSLKVPFTVLFEFKGFLGKAKVKIQSDGHFKNKEWFNSIDREEFSREARINPQILLDQTKCKIVRYQKQSPLSLISNQQQKHYFVQSLTTFLPFENISGHNLNSVNLLRPELIQDEQLQDYIFDGHKQTTQQKAYNLLHSKLQQFIALLESHSDYFTNSQELSQLLHSFGLSIRHIGIIYEQINQNWLRKLIQAEIAARCLKNFFRFDMQNCLLFQIDRLTQKQRQSQRQRKRAISFLNVIFGNTESTFRMWRNINSHSLAHFNCQIWKDNFNDINVGYFLQALQKHLKIQLHQKILSTRTFFKSSTSLDESDFISFELQVNTFNLDYTETFQHINNLLQTTPQSFEIFHELCQIITEQTNSKQPYLQLIKNHPIYYKINEYLLNFISPDDNIDLYNKIQTAEQPSRFMYESKLAEIRWYLKSNRHQHIHKPIKFINQHALKWLGPTHPIYTQLNRMLAQYFSQSQISYPRAVEYASISLKMQQTLLNSDINPILWKDYFLLGKIHYFNQHHDKAIPLLKKAKQMVNIENETQQQTYIDLYMSFTRSLIAVKSYKQGYDVAKDLYKSIRFYRDEASLINIIDCASIIRDLLELNQQHQSYFRFVEMDFSQILQNFVEIPALFVMAIKLTALPFLKNVVLQRTKHKIQLYNMIVQISHIYQTPNSCLAYLEAKTLEHDFPEKYFQNLQNIEEIMQEITKNQMMARWISFNNMSNQTLLEKIGGSQISRGFQFLAYMTAICNLLGTQVTDELTIMQK